MKLEGKVALVTGAGSGIGKEIAITFAREGAKIGVNDVDMDRIEATQREIRNLGSAALGLPTDVANSQQVKRMFGMLVDKFGTLDILVNNAGMGMVPQRVMENCARTAEQRLAGEVSKISLGATRYMTDEEWQRMIAVHLSGTFHCTREALTIMEEKGYGRIINIASVCGMVGCPTMPHYSAAKGGIIAFTKAVALEVINRGIFINCIAPGWIDTNIGGRGPARTGKIDGLPISVKIPLGRLGQVSEIASLALYLASDESSYMLGQIISPNGGAIT